MTDHVVEVLRAVDPARRMPLEESHTNREAIRESILASQVKTRGERGQKRPRLARSRRFRVVTLAAAVLVVVISSGAWASFSYISKDSKTVLEDFQAAQAEFSLPPGAHWTEPNLPSDSSYGEMEGWFTAWLQSSKAWLREWIAAHDANSRSREQAAGAAMDRLVSIMPAIKEGASENGPGGFDQNGIDLFHKMVAMAKQGDFSLIKQYLEANYPQTD
jgi:hypothetical protein